MDRDEAAAKWVRDAEKSGEMKNLKGFGKPLNSDDAFDATPEELKLAFKVLKDSGYVPPQVAYFKELAELRARLAKETDDEKRKAIQKQMAEKQMKIQMFAEGKMI